MKTIKIVYFYNYYKLLHTHQIINSEYNIYYFYLTNQSQQNVVSRGRCGYNCDPDKDL